MSSRRSAHGNITLIEGLIVLAVVGAGIWLALRPVDIAKQTALSTAMRNAGAEVVLNEDKSVRTLNAKAIPADQLRIDEIVQFEDLRRLNVDHSEIVDENIATFADHLDLSQFHAVGTAISDSGAADLSRFRDLISLDLRATFISDKGLGSVEGSETTPLPPTGSNMGE